MHNCPNCGAPRSGSFFCEYCGTHFENGKREITLELDGRAVARAIQPSILYSDNLPIAYSFSCGSPAWPIHAEAGGKGGNGKAYKTSLYIIGGGK